MNFDSKKIEINKSTELISVSDRMSIKFGAILILLTFTFALSTFFFGIIGIVYSVLFSLGYILFRYFAWVFWKKVEINTEHNTLTIAHMFVNKEKGKKVITQKFNMSNFILKEFEQSGMKRAMLQYKTHKLVDLILLTHEKDIEEVKSQLF